MKEGSLVSLRLTPRDLPLKKTSRSKNGQKNKENLQMRHGRLAGENNNKGFPFCGLADTFLKSAYTSFTLRTESAD